MDPNTIHPLSCSSTPSLITLRCMHDRIRLAPPTFTNSSRFGREVDKMERMSIHNGHIFSTSGVMSWGRSKFKVQRSNDADSRAYSRCAWACPTQSVVQGGQQASCRWELHFDPVTSNRSREKTSKHQPGPDLWVPSPVQRINIDYYKQMSQIYTNLWSNFCWKSIMMSHKYLLL